MQCWAHSCCGASRQTWWQRWCQRLRCVCLCVGKEGGGVRFLRAQRGRGGCICWIHVSQCLPWSWVCDRTRFLYLTFQHILVPAPCSLPFLPELPVLRWHHVCVCVTAGDAALPPQPQAEGAVCCTAQEPHPAGSGGHEQQDGSSSSSGGSRRSRRRRQRWAGGCACDCCQQQCCVCTADGPHHADAQGGCSKLRDPVARFPQCM